jgi:tRNA threonylcarbamoyladenosine modification (KEOPS) complex Cgi121 subunit
MLKLIKEYGKYVEITGFRGVKIENPPAFISALQKDLPKDVEAQLLEADLVASWQHLYFAVLNALMAHKNKRNISKSLAVETVLYASAQRQIKKAIDAIGVKPDSKNIAGVIISENAGSTKTGLSAIIKCLGAQPDETVLEVSKTKISRIRSAFKISDVELEALAATGNDEQALVDAVVERVALLSTQV